MFVRGTALRSLLAALVEEFGEDGLARVKRALPPDARERIDAPIDAAASFPVSVSAAMHEAIRTVLGDGTFKINRALAARAARIDFGGAHGAFVAAGDYDALLQLTARAWDRYNSHGRVEWSHIGKNEARGGVRYVRGYTEAMWHALAGRLETILELGCAKDPTVDVVGWSERHVEYLVRWRD